MRYPFKTQQQIEMEKRQAWEDLCSSVMEFAVIDGTPNVVDIFVRYYGNMQSIEIDVYQNGFNSYMENKRRWDKASEQQKALMIKPIFYTRKFDYLTFDVSEVEKFYQELDEQL
jgi:hypothetical protein